MSVPSDTDATSADDPRGGRQRRLGLRSLLLLVALLPLLGMATLAGISANDRWESRDTARAMAERTDGLDRLVEARIAVGAEHNYSLGIALAGMFGLGVDEIKDVSGVDFRAGLADARAAVDQLSFARSAAALEDARSDLESIRRRLDQGRAGFEAVTQAFAPLTDLLDQLIDDQHGRIIETATGASLPGDLMARLRALEDSIEAFAQVGPIGTYGTQVLVGSELLPELVTSQAVTRLIEATSRFEDAVQDAVAHEGLAAGEAWQEFRDDPAAQRTRESFEGAVTLGLEPDDQESAESGQLGSGFADAHRWSDLINRALQTAAADLGETADAQVDEETASMAWWLGSTALLALVAVTVALRIARNVTGPIGHMADAANRIRHGELDVDHIEPTGPRELASTAEAFNDMTATLTEVERRTIALAENPDDPTLTMPLPGRVGQALQVALDRLRVSIRLAEDRRAELQQVATHDGLTGLLNRTAALDALDRELAQSRRDSAHTFVLFIDLDGLKPINDTHGHDAGDDAIRLTADALRSATRDTDVVARLGGDEFLVAGRIDEGPVEVEALAARIVAAVGAQAVRVIDSDIPLRASAGIATTSPGADDESVDELVQRADTALYDAKRAGGSRTSWGTAVPDGDGNGID